MAKQFLTSINLTQNQLQNASIQPLSAAPGTPVSGQIYFDTTLTAIRVWDGTAWTNRATDYLLLQGNNGAYYLSRTNHTGTQLAATISNLAATVQAYSLSTFAAPTADLSIGGFKLLNVATPINGSDAANKNYVDASVQGLSQKPTARAATTGALATNTYANGTAGVGATLTASAVGVLTIDGYTPALNDVLLIKNEATAANNGLYTLTTVGTAGFAYVLTRSTVMNSSTTFGGGFVAVENTSVSLANTLWLCDVANVVTVGTTAITFVQINGATQLTAGNGISISANIVSVTATTGIVVTGAGVGVDFTIVPKKYSVTFGDGTSTSFTITHSLGTLDVIHEVYAVAGGAKVECDVLHASTTTSTLGFGAAPTASQYRIVCMG